MTRFQSAFATALLGSTALMAASALAQAPAPQPGTPATQNATVADCDRLITVLEQRRPANAGVTVE